MQAGSLRDRIEIQRHTQAKDEWGTLIPGSEAWVSITLKPIAADVKHPSGLGSIKADAEVSIVRASMRIRRRTDVDAGMRVLYGAAVYDIKAVLPGSTREYVDLVCVKVT